MHTYPGTPPRTPPHPPTRTRQRQARATPPAATGPEDMRHTHPTTRSHRSPPERPTAHTQASTHTHNRQAVNGPHTHAQPHRRDHHQPSQHQPPRPPAATTTTTTVTTARDDVSTNRSSTNHAQRSDQRKHQTSRRRNNQQTKNKHQQAQGITRGGARADRKRGYDFGTRASYRFEPEVEV